jgi:ankyrin repeat protein
MRMLLEQPMVVNRRTEPEGWTPLHLALGVGPTAPTIVKLLLNAGADPHLTDSKGLTAHDWALAAGNKDIAAILIHTVNKDAAKTAEGR